jgi:hypothetical protein
MGARTIPKAPHSSIFKAREEKPCFFCWKRYIPQKFKRGDEYMKMMFCSKECDDAYVKGALRKTQVEENG